MLTRSNQLEADKSSLNNNTHRSTQNVSSAIYVYTFICFDWYIFIDSLTQFIGNLTNSLLSVYLYRIVLLRSLHRHIDIDMVKV